MSPFDKAYFGYYFCIRNFFSKGPASWFPKEKAEILIAALELYAVVALFVWCAKQSSLAINVTGSKLAIALPLVLLVIGLNHFYFGNVRRNKEYEEYFSTLTPTDRSVVKLVAFAVTVILVLTIILMFHLAGRL